MKEIVNATSTKKKSGDTLPPERLLGMYWQMLRVRLLEEQVNQLYFNATMPGLSHLYIGQESVAVGVYENLRLDDYINMAKLWKLPVIFACENYLYNEYTPFEEATAGDLEARATAFGVPAATIDGQDIRTVYATRKNIWTRSGKARVRRMGAMDVLIPFSPVLENLTVPTEETVFEVARSLCGRN
ncbi:MAG TPA: thiamine pyrophosphate-dependent enzyme [Anaerolineales bacterium]|nr:thiamine pyrophosphate-dependent enzyme [Anaerolineales bacterium]